MLRKPALHTSHYSVGSLLVTAAGFFSFLTRIFSPADYGVMSLVSATLMLLVGVGKFGIQHAIIRYESDVRAGRQPFDLKTFYSTTVLGMVGTGLATAAGWALLSHARPAGWLNDRRLPGLFVLTSILVLIRCLDSCLVNHLRAEQQSRLLVKYQVGLKYLGLALMVGVLLLIARELRAFYAAMIVTEVLGTFVLLTLFFGPRTARRRDRGLRSGPSPPPSSGSWSASASPMMIGYELAGTILSVGDRYIIQLLIPGEPLGIYSAAYNLCEYAQTVFVLSMNQAIMPIYMRLWNEKGQEETRQFIGKALRYYVLLGAPLVAGMAAVGPELLPFLASEKYGRGALVVPYVMAGMLFDGANVVVGAGLFIFKQTRVIMGVVMGSAVLNVVLNAALIPGTGILGAAIATFLSYAALSMSMALAGSRRLRIAIPWGALAKAGGFSLVMYGMGWWWASNPVAG